MTDQSSTSPDATGLGRLEEPQRPLLPPTGEPDDVPGTSMPEGMDRDILVDTNSLGPLYVGPITGRVMLATSEERRKGPSPDQETGLAVLRKIVRTAQGATPTERRTLTDSEFEQLGRQDLDRLALVTLKEDFDEGSGEKPCPLANPGSPIEQLGRQFKASVEKIQNSFTFKLSADTFESIRKLGALKHSILMPNPGLPSLFPSHSFEAMRKLRTTIAGEYTHHKRFSPLDFPLAPSGSRADLIGFEQGLRTDQSLPTNSNSADTPPDQARIDSLELAVKNALNATEERLNNWFDKRFDDRFDRVDLFRDEISNLVVNLSKDMERASRAREQQQCEEDRRWQAGVERDIEKQNRDQANANRNLSLTRTGIFTACVLSVVGIVVSIYQNHSSSRSQAAVQSTLEEQLKQLKELNTKLPATFPVPERPNEAKAPSTKLSSHQIAPHRLKKQLPRKTLSQSIPRSESGAEPSTP